MNIRDPKLEAHVRRIGALLCNPSEERRLVCGLMDAHQFFAATEGDRSPRAEEALGLLLHEELRPALREWYRKAEDGLNPHPRRFRDRLVALTGEGFGR